MKRYEGVHSWLLSSASPPLPSLRPRSRLLHGPEHAGGATIPPPSTRSQLSQLQPSPRRAADIRSLKSERSKVSQSRMLTPLAIIPRPFLSCNWCKKGTAVIIIIFLPENTIMWKRVSIMCFKHYKYEWDIKRFAYGQFKEKLAMLTRTTFNVKDEY